MKDFLLEGLNKLITQDKSLAVKVAAVDAYGSIKSRHAIDNLAKVLLDSNADFYLRCKAASAR